MSFNLPPTETTSERDPRTQAVVGSNHAAPQFGPHPPVSPEALSQTVSRSSGQSIVRWCGRLLSRIWRTICAAMHWMFGLISMVVILSLLASYPLLQFLSLGYLLEVSGRVTRSRRLRDGFVGISTAANVGSAAVGSLLSLLPMYVLSSSWYSSYLLNGDTRQTQSLRLLTFVAGGLALLHIAWALFRGGKFRHFFWPAPVRFVKRCKQGGLYDEASQRLWDSCQQLRLPHYFSLGLRGFIGAFVWLVLPITLMSLATRVEVPELGGLMAFTGGVLLAIVLAYLPFLQARLPATNRFRDQFALGSVRREFQHAPLAYWIALLLVLILAIPLYVLKAELVPREAMWLPALFFVTFMWPARLAAGWAVGRGMAREEKRIWISRYLARLGVLPVVLLYSLIVYFTQFTSWYGALSLYEQHAFLVPVPFFSN